MIETSLLQVLIALSHNENISKAAEELNVTQSAVSQALKNIENKVGLSTPGYASERMSITGCFGIVSAMNIFIYT